MNVEFVSQIGDLILLLRNNVYNMDEFKDSFENNLKSNIGAINFNWTPAQYGGWNIFTNIDINKCEQINQIQVNELVHEIMKSLLDSLSNNVSLGSIGKDYKITSNLFNVIVTGPNSIVIRI